MLERRPFGNWAHCLKKLGKNLRLATAAEGMLDRIERYEANPDEKTHFDYGAWFAENFNVIDGRILGARAEFNPLLPYAEQAVKAHRNGNEFYLTKEIKMQKKPSSQLLNEIAEKDAKKPLWERSVVDLGKVRTHNVPTDSLADDNTIVWLAQGKELARNSGLFLRNPEIDIKEVVVCYSSLLDKDYARGFWLRRLDRGNGSNFDCSDRGLNGDYGAVFGVFAKSAKGTSQNFEQGKVRLFQPSFEDVLNYTIQFVGDINKNEFKKGLRDYWRKK